MIYPCSLVASPEAGFKRLGALDPQHHSFLGCMRHSASQFDMGLDDGRRDVRVRGRAKRVRRVVTEQARYDAIKARSLLVPDHVRYEIWLRDAAMMERLRS